MAEISEETKSVVETYKHVRTVGKYLTKIIVRLCWKMSNHDWSKFESPELEAFATVTPRLKSLTYGSEEYRVALREIRPQVQRHYRLNAHHPEHFKNGIDDMTLAELCEMLCDWQAASERHEDGDIFESIRKNKERFGISDQLERILLNTVMRVFREGP